MLEKLRLPADSSSGRRFPEFRHLYRSDYQRDRDRIIHSRAFRRLQGKTQVFAIGSDDHQRNRLTHTIEVSQVARTVASALQLNEGYTETLALAHDLGHPPFGHVGERELDRHMKVFGAGFEHNLHALRIVDVLEQRYPLFDGLNLTFEVREGIVKHSREITSRDEPELQEFLPDQAPPLEAQLIDPADEIAYNSADLDDAFDAGLISLDELADAVPRAISFADEAETQFPGASPRIRFWQVQRQLMNLLIGGLIQGTVEAVSASGVAAPDDVRLVPHRLAHFSSEAQEVNRQMKRLLVDRAYSSPQLDQSREAAVRKLGALFEHLIEHPQLVSAGYREHLANNPAHRVICDYIAGMTDAYLFRVYEGIAD